MKKKIISIILAMFMCVSVLTGCSLVTRNDQKYYEAVVATITYSDGVKENVTKRDLISAFNSYGYNYVQNYGYTQKRAVQQTLESVIEQRLTIKEVKDAYAKNGEQVLNDNETTYLYDQTYETLLDNLKSYYQRLMNITQPEDDETEDSSAFVFEQYVPNARVEKVTTQKDGKTVTEYVIKKTATTDTTRATYVAKQDDEGRAFNFEYKDESGKFLFKEKMYADIISRTEGQSASAKNWRSALNKYLADIRSNFSYKTFKDNKDCFMFEMDRIYNIMRDNYLVQKYSEIHNKQSQQDSNLSNVTVSDILNAYSAKVRADFSNQSTFESNILSSVKDVDYVVDNGNSYFFVGYVKMNLSDEDKEALEAAQNDKYLSETKKREEIEKIYGRVVAKVRDAKTGEETGETITPEQLLAKMTTDVEAYKFVDADEQWQKMIENGEIDEESFENDDARQQAFEDFKSKVEQQNKAVEIARAEAFRKYLYQYNDDDSIKGADYGTVFGVNATSVLSSSFTDNTQVNDAIRLLYADGKAKVGDMTDVVRSDDGLYVFFYAGKIENLFAVNDGDFDISSNLENINVLTQKRINIFSEKTLFDVLYDELSTDNFTSFQNMNIRALRNNAKIKSYENNIKDLY